MKHLNGLGLPVSVSRGETPFTFSRQPCAALCTDRKCRLYAERPQQCRTFECGVFKAAQTRRMTFAAALRAVKQARRKADRIRQLLRQLGDNEEHRALGNRIRRTQQRIETSVADPATAEAFGELGLAMHQLNLLAHEKFFTKPEAP